MVVVVASCAAEILRKREILRHLLRTERERTKITTAKPSNSRPYDWRKRKKNKQKESQYAKAKWR